MCPNVTHFDVEDFSECRSEEVSYFDAEFIVFTRWQRADMAVAGMVINSDRETVVDFTKPYMNYGVGILLRKPQKKSNVFAFLEPLDIKVCEKNLQRSICRTEE